MKNLSRLSRRFIRSRASAGVSGRIILPGFGDVATDRPIAYTSVPFHSSKLLTTF